jgi:hypothetical protein
LKPREGRAQAELKKRAARLAGGWRSLAAINFASPTSGAGTSSFNFKHLK